MYRLCPETFIESLNSRPEATLRLLADDYRSYDATAAVANIAQKLADCFVEIIRRASGNVPKDDLEKKRLSDEANSLKQEYGNYLREEAGNTCAFPGCGRRLIQTSYGQINAIFEIAVIDKTKDPTIDNLLALCPYCHGTYLFDANKKRVKELLNVKKSLLHTVKAKIFWMECHWILE